MFMELYASAFEKVCEVVSVLFIVVAMTFGFVFGYGFIPTVIDSLYNDFTLRIIVGLLFLFLCTIITILFNIVIFGFIAQITEIKKQLKKINK